MKNLLKGFFLTILISFCISPIFAEEVTLEQLTPDVKAAEIENLDVQEDERKKAFEAQLGFTIPLYTDNPSYVITFVDPSPNKNGVQIEIDNDKYTDITSPYTLPALSIGQHHLSFRFTDKDGALQQLEYDMSVLPRAPIIKAPTYTETVISLSGTGLANSEVILFLSSNSNSYTEIVSVNSDGNWNVEITPDSGNINGIYTVVGYTRKYGYASNLSKPVVFEVGNTTAVVTDKITNDIFFAFGSITKDNVRNVFSQNKDLSILLGAILIIGILIGIFLKALITNSVTSKKLKSVEQSIKSTGKTQDKTLRELFETKTDIKAPKEFEAKKELSIEKKDNSKVISKEEFLKKFKMLDPDDNKGNEIQKPTEKKEIKISLTSQREE